MAKQTAKASTGRGRKKVAVKDLSQSEQKLSTKQLKKVKGGISEITVTKKIDKSSTKLF